MDELYIHSVAHRFAEEIIIPYNALDDNLGLLKRCKKRVLICADGVRAELLDYAEKHLCELEEDIQRIYKMDAMSFVKRWYNSSMVPRSMYFLKMKLRKEG